MLVNVLDAVLLDCLRQRRQRLALQFAHPILLWSGGALPRNFPANRFPFRASSHFLYFAGIALQDAVIYLHQGQLTLYIDEPDVTDALWHGPSPSRDQIATIMGADAAYPLVTVQQVALEAATILVQDLRTRQHQEQVLGRSLKEPLSLDQSLAEAIVQLRLVQDASAIQAIQDSVAVTIQAHRVGIAHTRHAKTEVDVRAAMEAVILAADMTTAYSSIVTTHGEVLHSQSYRHSLQGGDLLLVDVGAEHPLGWAADVTRTWPVSGEWSSTQRALYNVVLAAHDACIAALEPGVEFAAIHLLAAQTIIEGLVDLGILRGNVDTLVERAAHALFFPHGIGHLLGLDVHDMEDLGDLAGYAPGRNRSKQCGMQYLRLNRPLQAGMVVTIEPGFYQVPAILEDTHRRTVFADCVNWERLSDFRDVRGIRIEDDVHVTETGHTVLTSALPVTADEIVAGWAE
jgi:Xaa-Pro aminopeptidase